MYTLLELESKTFGELKKIGYELDILPAGDRRRRQSWIDALVNVNPPLLALLEASPAGEVPAQKLLRETVEKPPGAEVQHQESLESKFGRIAYPKSAAKPIAQNEEARPHLDRIQGANVHNLGSHSAKPDGDSSGAKTEALGSQEGDRVLAVARDCETDRGRVLPDQSIKLVNQAQESIALVPETSPGVDLIDDELPECSNCFGDGYTEDEFGSIEFCKSCQCKTEPKLSHQKTQRAIASAAKNLSDRSLKTSIAHQFLELFKSSARIIEDSPGVEVDRTLSHQFLLCLKEGHNTLWYDGKNFVCEKWSAKTYCKRGVGSAKHQLRHHPEVKRLGNLQVVENSPADKKLIEVQATEPIEPVAKTSPGFKVDRVEHPIIEMVETFPAAEVEQTQEAIAQPVETDRNSILKGIVLSDRFIARYCPPQAEIIHFKSDTDGQLSLIDFEVQSVNEPPDPDDFESLDAFREAIALWEEQNPEPLDVSLDSMCEWAPCPHEWYEPKAENLPLKASSRIELSEQSQVMELLRGGESCSDTSEFFIPTFGSLGDRFKGRDEPPDTGLFARLPKPKPPTFPPQAIWLKSVSPSESKSAQVSLSQPKSARHPETIPKLFHCVVAGTNNQPARSPPGGDAMS